MKITKEQLAFIDSFKLDRLSTEDAHKDIIQSFENWTNPGLSDHLKSCAWNEDEERSNAYYILKDPNGVPLLYFSLKCGALIEALDEAQLKDNKNVLYNYIITLQNPDVPENVKGAIKRTVAAQYDIEESDVFDELLNILNFKSDKIGYIIKDRTLDPNGHIMRVEYTHSGIELVHFCANDAAKEVWNSYKIPQPLGKVVYWHFMVPILAKIREIVGCKYLFLFAADTSADQSLINYYQRAFGLYRPDNIGASKPFYDLNCAFMCREINSLIQERDRFYQDFNPDINVPIV